MSGVQPAGTGPQPTEAGSAATRPARRRRRWALRALGVAVAGALLLSAALVLLLTLGLQHGLNSDWARQQLRAQVNERTGAELDYRTLQLNLASGLLVEDLVVLQPSVFRAHAPELLRLSRLELGYRPLLLPLGRLTVETLRARGLQLTLVQDASGRTSLDRLADDKPQQPEPPEPPPPPEAPAVAAPVTPLTRALELADLPLTVQLGELSVTELAVNALALDAGGAVSRRIELRGVQVQGHATLRPGHPEAALRVVSPPDGLQLKITEPGPSGPSQRSLRLALSQGLQVVDAHQVRGSLRIELHEQSFEPRFRYLGPLVGLQLAAKLDPEAGDITATLSDVELLAGAAHVSATATVHEELDGPVRRLSAIVGSTGSVDLQRAHATAEPLVGPTGIKELRGTFQWALSDLRLDLDTFAPYGGQLALDTQVQRLLGDVGGASLDGEELGLKVEFAPLDEDSYRLEVGAPVGRLHASVAGQRLRLRQAELRLEIPAAHPSWLSPASSWGELVLKLRAGGLFVASGPDRVQASTVGLRLKVMRQRRGGPLRLDLNGGVRELDVHRGDTLLVPIRKGTVKLTGRNLRPDLGQLIQGLLAKNCTPRLNTNGLTLTDPQKRKRLKEAGLKWVILQFDGFSETASVKLRGENLIQDKLHVIEQLGEEGFSIHLAVMLERGINDQETARILEFSLQNRHVKRLSFYPRSQVGRNEDASNSLVVHLSDVLTSLESGTGGKVTRRDILEMKGLWHLLYLATRRPVFRQRICIAPFVLLRSRDGYVPLNRLFKPSAILKEPRLLKHLATSLGRVMAYDRAAYPDDILLVNIEKFYHTEAFDLDEAMNCHHIYVTPKGFIPFCLYNSFYRSQA